ncbi:Sesquiterpene cyclase astC [Cladobotryum mycophilum]|uniref:Sesquiterpene cyclase astC n=1 Tax=Cladobotryum mycophilum TaxID=491253 RepID=A0ABR0S9I0_9HYPO
MASQYQHLILDIGGVLLSYSSGANTVLPPRTIKTILDSPYWADYERGKFSQQQCYETVCAEFGLELDVWQEAVEQLKSTLEPNLEFIAAVREIKTSYPNLCIHALSNLSAPDFEHLKPAVTQWGIFDSIITSSSIGQRKPDMAAYRLALEAIGAETQSVVFVDDMLENILMAHSLGIRAVHFKNTLKVIQQLHNLLGDPVSRGLDFLHQRAKNLVSDTSKGVAIKDNLTQLLVLQCIGKHDLVDLEDSGPTWQFFIGERTFTDAKFPNDSDTTSLAHAVFDFDEDRKRVAMDTIMQYVTPDGYPSAYHDHKRPRMCPVVCANVFRFFALNGQAARLQSTHDYLVRILDTQAYEFGTRYYLNHDWMLYFLADLCGRRSDPELSEIRDKVTTQLKRRIGIDKDVLGAAMRLLASQSLGLANPEDLKTLLKTQQVDGGWEVAWLWNYGQVDVQVGSRAVPTAMAVRGIATALGRELTT